MFCPSLSTLFFICPIFLSVTCTGFLQPHFPVITVFYQQPLLNRPTPKVEVVIFTVACILLYHVIRNNLTRNISRLKFQILAAEKPLIMGDPVPLFSAGIFYCCFTACRSIKYRFIGPFPNVRRDHCRRARSRPSRRFPLHQSDMAHQPEFCS